MSRLNILLVLLFGCSLAGHCFPPAAELQKLTVGKITITYPTGLEAQAQELAKVAADVAPARLESFQKVQQAMENEEEMTRRITEMLGNPACAATVRLVLNQCTMNGAQYTLYSTLLTDWRIYRLADIRAAGGLTEGAMQITYDPKTDLGSTSFRLKYADGKLNGSPKAFMPFIVKDDGAFRLTKGKATPVEAYEELCGIVLFGQLSSIHEATEMAIIKDLQLFHPYSRWFNEGAANWIAYRLACEIAPERRDAIMKEYFPPADMPLRSKANLLNWPQNRWLSSHLTEEEQALDSFNYGCTTELMRLLFEDQPPTALAETLKRLQGRPNADTWEICAAITAVTGKNALALFSEYVPADVRAEMGSAHVKAALVQATEQAQAGKYADALARLQRSLAANPCDVDTHLNVAWLLRKTGAPQDDVELQIRIAGELGLHDEHLSQFICPDDIEAMYLAAYIYQRVGETDAARQRYQAILARDPNHADARAGLQELEGRK